VKNTILFTFLAGLFFSCKKEKTFDPIASFNFRNDTSSVFRMATYDTCTLFSNSINADSVLWNLGNGTTARGKSIVLSYPVSGTYNITLTVTNKEGKQSNLSKKVIVLDRVLKKIIIKQVYWDTIPNNINHFNYVWPQSSKAEIFVQLQQYRYGDSIVPYSGILPNSPVLYSSPHLHNISYNNNTPLEINVPGKVIVDKKMVLDRTFVVALLAKDTNNVVYNLLSNLSGGSSFGIQKEKFPDDFLVICSLLSSVELVCTFE
jgi:hypothetical protein